MEWLTSPAGRRPRRSTQLPVRLARRPSGVQVEAAAARDGQLDLALVGLRPAAAGDAGRLHPDPAAVGFQVQRALHRRHHRRASVGVQLQFRLQAAHPDGGAVVAQAQAGGARHTDAVMHLGALPGETEQARPLIERAVVAPDAHRAGGGVDAHLGGAHLRGAVEGEAARLHAGVDLDGWMVPGIDLDASVVGVEGEASVRSKRDGAVDFLHVARRGLNHHPGGGRERHPGSLHAAFLSDYYVQTVETLPD